MRRNGVGKRGKWHFRERHELLPQLIETLSRKWWGFVALILPWVWIPALGAPIGTAAAGAAAAAETAAGAWLSATRMGSSHWHISAGFYVGPLVQVGAYLCSIRENGGNPNIFQRHKKQQKKIR